MTANKPLEIIECLSLTTHTLYLSLLPATSGSKLLQGVVKYSHTNLNTASATSVKLSGPVCCVPEDNAPHDKDDDEVEEKEPALPRRFPPPPPPPPTSALPQASCSS